MAIIRQIPWTEQPQYAVGVDWSNPLSAGLDVLFSTPSAQDAVGRTTTAIIGAGGTTSACSFGIGSRFSGTNTITTTSPNVADGTSYALMALFIRTATGTLEQIWTQDGGSGASRINQFRVNSSNQLELIVFNTAGATGSVTSTAVVAGNVYCAVAVAKTSGELSLYVNGVKTTGTFTGTLRSPSTSVPPPNIGNRFGVSEPFTGVIGALARWSGDVPSDAAAFSISVNPWQLFAPRVQRIPATATISSAQLIRPSSDISSGAWTPSTGVDLYAMLDETTSSDTDFITTTTASTAEVQLTTASDPAVSTGHIVRYRAKGTGTLTVKLMQGATTIATHVPTLTTSYQTFTFTLSGAEADSITDYSNLRLQFVSS